MISAVRRRRVAPGSSVALLAAMLVAACSGSGGAASSQPTTSTEASAAASAPAAATCPATQPDPLPAGETRTVTIETDKGAIAIKVEADLSPIAGGNFVTLAECGYYDGVVFHRVVPGFVIQGGDGEFGRSPDIDPNTVGSGGPGYTITDELVTATYSRGTVAMARTSEPNSVGSQFFIVLDDAARVALSSANTYQIIGTVSSGMDAVDAIAAAADAEIPTNPVVMTSMTVSTP